MRYFLICSLLIASGDQDPVACLLDGEEGCTYCHPASEETNSCPPGTLESEVSCDENGYTEENSETGSTIYLNPDTFLGWEECME